MKQILGIVLIAIVFVSYIEWTNKKDVERAEWAAKYETCVSETYATTPSAWYQEHGEYPTCPAR